MKDNLTYNNKVVNWKTTCYNRAWLRHRDILRDVAKKLEYPFFAWNGWIFETETYKDTGILVEDLDNNS